MSAGERGEGISAVASRRVRVSPGPQLREPFHDAWLANEGCVPLVRLARAQAAEMAAAAPSVADHELIVGGCTLDPIVTGRASPFGNGIRLNVERADAIRREHPELAECVDAVVSYWRTWLSEHGNCTGLTCHSSLAYERVIELGVDGLRGYVSEWRSRNAGLQPDRDVWYEALLITVDGIAAFIEAHAQAVRDRAAATPDTDACARLLSIAGICDHVAHGAPRTFHEAVQLLYLVFLLCGHDSPGPIDRYLYPPFARDRASGALTLERAQEIVDALWLKFEERTAYGATLAGQLPDGSDATNELSFVCLESIRRLRILSPRTTVRWHPAISREFLERACDVVAEGASYPAFVNDESVIAAAVDRGMVLEDAREYTFVGCGQVHPHGRGHGSYEDVVVNGVRAIELALRDGVDPHSGQREGPATGAPAELRTWEEFERAYCRQMDAMIGGRIEAVNQRREATRGHAFDLLRSLLTRSCVERGLDWHEGGADYSEGMVDVVGLPTVTDSLVAIKLGVFEQQLVTLEELVAVLDRDWEGHEALRQRFLRHLPKFGNGDALGDGIAVAETARINDFIRTHRTVFGGPWGMDIIGWSASVLWGEETGATPDGRRAGEPLADCAGPAQGRNTSGLTTTLNSVALLPHRSCHGPLALSLRFPKEAVQGLAGRARLRAVVEAYFRQGGQQLQISIASTADMKAALERPEEFGSLMVRVGGFSAYFVQLERRWQDDLIARSEMEL